MAYWCASVPANEQAMASHRAVLPGDLDSLQCRDLLPVNHQFDIAEGVVWLLVFVSGGEMNTQRVLASGHSIHGRDREMI